jgi:hypothetical protein
MKPGWSEDFIARAVANVSDNIIGGDEAGLVRGFHHSHFFWRQSLRLSMSFFSVSSSPCN